MGRPNTVLRSFLLATRVGPVDKVTLTVVMKASDVNHNAAPCRNRDHRRFTGSVSNDERRVLCAVLRNLRCLCHR